jgi:hypothetical protein
MCAPLIRLAIGMLAAIHFNDEMSVKGSKIHNVSSDHRLSLEFQTFEAMGTKKVPEPSLSLSHVGTKSFRVTARHTPLPARLTSSHPLPQGERGRSPEDST